MQWNLIVFTVIVVVVNAKSGNSLVASDIFKCDEHKEQRLNNTVCEKFCNNTYPGYCNLENCPKCVCKAGYARESIDGNCIPLSKCIETYPPNCGPNEVLTTCASVCPRACLGKNTTEDLSRCSLCLTGCVCKPGYIKVIKGGTCVPEGYCSMICEEGEVYNECGSACPPSCQKLESSCDKSCKKGCFCKRGFIRNEMSGKCVHNRDCLFSATDV